MDNQQQLQQLRQHPTEWHRRGLTSPTEIAALVAHRLGLNYPVAQADDGEPSYADFFVAPAAA